MINKDTTPQESGGSELSFDEFDEMRTPAPEVTGFERVVAAVVSRRGFLAGGMAWGSAAFVAGSIVPPNGRAQANERLEFEAIAANTQDTVTLPPGFSWHTVARWGDPLWADGAEFDRATRGTGESQERAIGDNIDGMYVFSRGGRHVLAVNNEYTNNDIIHANRQSKKPEAPDDFRKSKAAHGISVAEISQQDGKWSIVKDSSFNRRITADTPIEISGPARGHRLMKTAADPAGTSALGTWNNCGGGHTPWGTYLSCEENFNGYFSASDATFEPNPDMKR